jgi:hypothetical protein
MDGYKRRQDGKDGEDMKHGVAEFSDGKDMLVWDIEGETPKVRRVVAIRPNGGCYAASGDSCGLFGWSHYRPIPEKKTRPMTRDEVVLFCINRPHMAVRFENNQWQAPGYHNFDFKIKFYEWCDTSSGTFGPPQKFEVEE